MNLSFGGVAAMDYHVCVLTLETVHSIRSYADTTRKSLNVLSDGGALDRRQSVCVLNHVDSLKSSRGSASGGAYAAI